MTTTQMAPATTAQSTTVTPHRIVVGVDGSPGSRAAMRWAVIEARRTGAEIEAVNVVAPIVPLDFTGSAMAAPITWDSRELRASALESIDEVLHATPAREGIAIHRIVVESRTPGNLLLQRAHRATMLVVGAHQHHGLGFLLGSTGVSCIRHATCPVVVIPEDWMVDEPVRGDEPS